MICPDVDFSIELHKLISEKVIRLSTQEIQEIYRYWQENFDEDLPAAWSDLKIVANKALISEEQKTPPLSYLSGIDFPTWFGGSGAGARGKRIMVIGIDPLRNERAFSDANANMHDDVIIGTPFALHNRKMRQGKTSRYWAFAEGLSKSHFVYLTDIYKTFFYTDASRKGVRSYVYYRNSGNNEKHIELLAEEIELIRPDLIVTFGAETYRQIFPGRRAPKLSVCVRDNIAHFHEYSVMPMVHLSRSSRERNIKDFLSNNGVECKPGQNYGELYCKMVSEFLEKKS